MQLRQAGASREDAEQAVRVLARGVIEDVESAADRTMLEYALKLTRAPSTVVCDDILALRRAGFSDRAIHDICAITAYYAFVNRIADGLGVEEE